MSSFDKPWQEHFGTKEAQAHAAVLGMWIFIATEVLLFAGLFVAYAEYRHLYPEAFARGVADEKAYFGAIMSLILITASFLAAMAVVKIREGKSFTCGVLLIAAAVVALGFLAMHGVEYWHHVAEGKGPGEWYTSHVDTSPGANLFYTLWWLMTMLHVVHVIVGVCVLSIIGIQSLGGKFDADYHTAVMNGTLYFQIVDTFWMFLYPLFYLAH